MTKMLKLTIHDPFVLQLNDRWSEITSCVCN